MSLVVACALLWLEVGISQESPRGEVDVQEMTQQLKKKQQQQSVLPDLPGFVLESTVDPDAYVVGPYDLIGVNVWGNPPMNEMVTVTPEGKMIIPSIGVVSVADSTLSRVKQQVTEAVRRIYRSGEITVALLRPRPVLVTVVGCIAAPGVYQMASVDRVNRVLEEVDKAVRQGRATQRDPGPDRISTRNIVLRRRDGTTLRVDILRFLATHDNRWNPYLREGDVIAVPQREADNYVFAVYGEVAAPGRFEWVAGDSLLSALHMAQGITPVGRQDSIVLLRQYADGTAPRLFTVDLRASTGSTVNLPLEPGDRIIVPRLADARHDDRVTVTGEVRMPGHYPIVRNQSTLRDVIRAAGGFTPDAGLSLSNVYRRSVAPDARLIARIEALRSLSTLDDTLNLRLEQELRLYQEPLNIDFTRLFTSSDAASDVVLQPGDSIVVPLRPTTVYVFGQVLSPGHIPFVPGEGLRYYLERSGGVSDAGNTSAIKLIKGRTRQWLAAGESSIEPGDQVWVPREAERNFAYYLNLTVQAASIFSVIIGMAVVIVQLRK